MKDINIIIFGDSITYGAADNVMGGWANRMRLYFDSNVENNFTLFNFGIPGNITENVIERFNGEVNVRFDKEDITIIVFSIGINDTKLIGKEDEFLHNIQTLISMSKEYTRKIVFVGLNNVIEDVVNPLYFNGNIVYENNRISTYDKIIKETCILNDVKYVNIFGLLDKEDFFDGLHPNSAGHEKIFNVLVGSIKDSIDIE